MAVHTDVTGFLPGRLAGAVFLAVVLALGLAPLEASADPRCPAGYKVVHDEEDDSFLADRDDLICLPEAHPLDGEYYDGAVEITHFWAAVVVAEADGQLTSSVNQRSWEAAERDAVRRCKADLKERQAKGKCRVMGRWSNGDAFVAKGEANRVFFARSAEEAMRKCSAQGGGCAIALTVTSFGAEPPAR